MRYVPNLRRIRQALTATPKIKAIVVGDIMLDEHVVYRKRQPDEKKWYQRHEEETIYKVEDESLQVGGAATVARAIETLTDKVYLFGVLGKDFRSEIVRKIMKKRKKISSHLYFTHDRCTTRKLRLYEEEPARPVCRERFDTEEIKGIPDELTEKMLRYIRGIISRNSEGKEREIVMIIQDFEKGVITPRMVRQLAKFCSRNQVFLVVDPKYDWDKYRQCPIDAVVPNEEEAITALGQQGSFLPSHEYQLWSQYKTIKNFVITRSSFGARVIIRGKNGIVRRDFRGHKLCLEPTSVVGCGDVFTGIFACLLARGCGVLDSCAAANLAAAMQVAKRFGEFVTVDDINTHIDEIRENIQFSVPDKDITFVNHLVEGLKAQLDLSEVSFEGVIAVQGTDYRKKLEAIKKFLLRRKSSRLLLIGESDTGKSHVVKSLSKSIGLELKRIPSQELIDMKPDERYALIQCIKNKRNRGILFIDEYLSKESTLRCYLEKDRFVCDPNNPRLTLSTDDFLIVATGGSKEWDAIPDKQHTKNRFPEIIELPELSDHLEDVPYLVLQELIKLRRSSTRVSRATLVALMLYVKRKKIGFVELSDTVKSFANKDKISYKDLPFGYEKMKSQWDKSFVKLRTNKH